MPRVLFSYAQIGHQIAETVCLTLSFFHFRFETIFAPDLDDFYHPGQYDFLLEYRVISKMLRDQDSTLRIECAVDCSGHKKTLKCPGFFFQEGMVGNLFLDDPPFIKGENHEITIPIG